MPRAKGAVIAAAVATALCTGLVGSLPFENPWAAQWLRPGDPLLPLDVAFAWASVFAVLRALLRVGARGGRGARGEVSGRLARAARAVLPATWDARGIASCALIMLVVWVPALLLTWPGSSSPDTINMLYQYATPAPTYYWTLGTVVDAEFINHHPVLDTFVCGAFWQLGGLMGDHTWGFFLFSLADFAFASAVMGALLCFASARLSAPRWLVVAGQLFFTLFPAFPFFFSYMSKDAIFVPWFLLWVLLFVGWWQGGGVPTPGRAAAFVLVSVLCALTKQLALVVIVPSVVVLAFHLRGARARGAALGELAVSLVLALAVFPAVVYPLVGGVAPGGRQEVLGTPINQVVTLYEEDPGAFSAEERQMLDQVIDLDRVTARWGRGGRFRVDRAKNGFRPDATSGDIATFLRLWAQKGLEYPGRYLATTWTVCMPLFMPAQGISTPLFVDEQYLQQHAERFAKRGLAWTELDLHQPEEFRQNQQGVHDSVTTAAELPVVGIFFTIGLYSGWLPFLCFAALACRRSRGLWAFAPVGVFWLLQLVDPAAFMRYAMPLIALAPFLLAWTGRLVWEGGGDGDAVNYKEL